MTAANSRLEITAEMRNDSPVALVKTVPQHERVIEGSLRAMELAIWKQYTSSGADVALKPNLGKNKLILGAIKTPCVVESVIIAIKDCVGSIPIV